MIEEKKLSYYMREIIFYRTEKDRCPVEEFLDTLSDKQVEKYYGYYVLSENLKEFQSSILRKCREIYKLLQ
jgi:hypothetical protein